MTKISTVEEVRDTLELLVAGFKMMSIATNTRADTMSDHAFESYRRGAASAYSSVAERIQEVIDRIT